MGRLRPGAAERDRGGGPVPTGPDGRRDERVADCPRHAAARPVRAGPAIPRGTRCARRP